MAIRDILRAHPNLKPNGGCRKTSNADSDYNCISWAAEVTDRWWWPWPNQKGFYWPVEAPNESTVEAFEIAFRTLGYVPCPTADLEPEFQKVAIYARDGRVRHMARQLRNGTWTSKIGELEDITHRTPAALEDAMYGDVVRILRQPWPGKK